ncbi:MAG: hypothetical protein ACYS30_00040 [Planctomycetota bacterium]|jgi:hypothetical protein
MKKGLCLALVINCVTVLLASPAGAQDRQLLEYRSAREARKTIGSVATKYLKPTEESPQGVELPKFEYRTPLFLRWNTPMVKAGGLSIALDRSDTSSVYDLLFIDSDGDGNLDDETAVTAYKTDRQHAYFGPVKVIFEGKDDTIDYHLNFRLCDHGRRSLFASPGGWYEGTITVGGKEKHCVLVDYDANGTFDDKSINASGCDRVRIGKNGDEETHFVGNYIEIEGTLYQLEIAREGAYVKLATAEDVTFGNIRLPESITSFAAGGENGRFVRKPKNGICSLPVGQYCIDNWAIERKDDAGGNWRLQGSGFSEKGRFNVTETQEAELSIGEPIISTLEANDKKGNYSFRHNLKGRLNESISITLNGKRPPAPKLNIKSKDGTYDRTFDFQYG